MNIEQLLNLSVPYKLVDDFNHYFDTIQKIKIIYHKSEHVGNMYRYKIHVENLYEYLNNKFLHTNQRLDQSDWTQSQLIRSSIYKWF